jgi:aldose 1-epimerase
MSYVFKDGEENYPGTVPLRVIYSVTDDNEFVVAYDATAVDNTRCQWEPPAPRFDDDQDH